MWEWSSCPCEVRAFQEVRPFLTAPEGSAAFRGLFPHSKRGGRVCGKGTWRKDEAPACGLEGKVVLTSLVAGEVPIRTTVRGQARPGTGPECNRAKQSIASVREDVESGGPRARLGERETRRPLWKTTSSSSVTQRASPRLVYTEEK